MRKVFFFLSLVLGIFHTLDANALEAIPSHSFEVAKQESAHFSQHSQSENLYLADHLIDIEEDEITDPASDKISLEKNTIQSISFVTTDFHASFFRNILANQHFYHRQSSHFISLRVLKL